VCVKQCYILTVVKRHRMRGNGGARPSLIYGLRRFYINIPKDAWQR